MKRNFFTVAVVVFIIGNGSIPTFGQEPSPSVVMETRSLMGELFENTPQEEQGHRRNGFRYLEEKRFYDRNLFWDVGFYFEHVFNGDKSDNWRQSFTPEIDPCFVFGEDTTKASLFWPSESSSWGLECLMNFSLSNYYLDMHFQVTPTVSCWPKNWLGFMWASYVDQTIDRKIYYYGIDRDKGRIGWCPFGEERPNVNGELWADMGVVPWLFSQDLPADSMNDGIVVCNISNATSGKKFALPLYYGLVDGDNDLSTSGDTMCYLMMFDQLSSIRLAMFNWSMNDQRPAWDWQYIIRDPQVGKTYGYRARFAYFPWRGERQGRRDVLSEYARWKSQL